MTEELKAVFVALERTQKENRWLKVSGCFGGGTLILVVSALLVGPASAQPQASLSHKVEAQEINLRYANGNLAAQLTVNENGPELIFFDENGTRRVLLVGGTPGSGLSIYDKNGKVRIGLLSAKKTSEIILFDEDRKPRVWLQTSKIDSASAIGLYDKSGRPRVSLGTSRDDTGLVLYDRNETIRAVLGTTSKMTKKRSESSLIVLDKEGELIWETP